MQEYRWPEAIDALVKLLSDERDFSSDPGYLRGSSWSEFRVARAAARALGAYEQLPEDAVTALLDAIQAETRDPFVACAAIAALADKDDDRISDAINVALESSGMKCAPEHRPLAQAAAWSAFDRAVANKPMQLSSTAIGMANEDSPVVAGPLLMAAGVLGGETQKVLARRLEGPKFAARAALMKVCAVVAEPERDTEFTGLESILAELASGTEWKDLSKKRQAEVQGWSDSLDPSNDVERFTAWVLELGPGCSGAARGRRSQSFPPAATHWCDDYAVAISCAGGGAKAGRRLLKYREILALWAERGELGLPMHGFGTYFIKLKLTLAG